MMGGMQAKVKEQQGGANTHNAVQTAQSARAQAGLAGFVIGGAGAGRRRWIRRQHAAAA